MTIDRVGGGGNQAVLEPFLKQQDQLAGQPSIDPTKLLAELLQSVKVLQGAGAKESVDPRTGPPGAPALEAPSGDFSADQLALLLGALDSKNKDGQIGVAKGRLELTKTQKESIAAQAIEKIKEAAKKEAEAEEKGKLGKIFGWIGKIAAFVAAIVATVCAAVATVATGGAAAPLLALAVMGLVATGMDLANHISQNLEPPGPEINMGKFIMAGAAKFLEACGCSPEDAKKFAPILAMACPGAVILAPEVFGEAAAAIGVAAGMNPDDAKWLSLAVTLAVTITVAVVMVVATGGMGAVDGIAKTAQTVGRITQAAGAIVSGGSNIAQGAVKIDQAGSVKEAEMARAQKLDLDKLLKKLQAQMEEERDKIKDLMESLDQSMQVVSQMIKSASDTRVQMTRNVV